MSAAYAKIRCEVCGVPWNEHTPACSRHAYNPRLCQGHGRGGLRKCCERAGEYNGFASDGPLSFTCPESCSCHD